MGLAEHHRQGRALLARPIPGPRFWVACWPAALLACALLAADGPLLRADILDPGRESDFKSFYLAARLAGRGGDIYDLEQLQAAAGAQGIPGPVFPYLYPPLLAHALRPLAMLSPPAAQQAWAWLGVVLFSLVMITGAAAAARHLAPDPARPSLGHALLALLLGAGLCLLLPYRNNLLLGQVNLLVLAALAVPLSSRGRVAARWGPPLWALAALIKVTPAVLLAYPLARRRPREALGGVAWALGLAAACLALGGVGPWRAYLAHLPGLAHGQQIPGLFPAEDPINFSLVGALLRWTGGAPWAAPLAQASAAALLGLAAWAVSRVPGERAASPGQLPLLVIMVAASPLAFRHHVIYLYPAACLALAHALRAPAGLRGALALGGLVAALGVAGADLPQLYPQLALGPAAARAVTSLNLYALLGLYLAGLAQLRVRPGAPPAPQAEDG